MVFFILTSKGSDIKELWLALNPIGYLEGLILSFRCLDVNSHLESMSTLTLLCVEFDEICEFILMDVDFQENLAIFI